MSKTITLSEDAVGVTLRYMVGLTLSQNDVLGYRYPQKICDIITVLSNGNINQCLKSEKVLQSTVRKAVRKLKKSWENDETIKESETCLTIKAMLFPYVASYLYSSGGLYYLTTKITGMLLEHHDAVEECFLNTELKKEWISEALDELGV